MNSAVTAPTETFKRQLRRHARNNADPWDIRRLLFWAILLFAAVARLKNLSTGLPLHTLYGENDSVQILIRMLQTGDLDPHRYDLPALAYYVYLPLLYSFYLIGRWTAHFTDLGAMPQYAFIFAARLVCALFGIATVYWIFRIGRFFSLRVALFAMAVLAASPQHIEFSHMVRPEIPAIFFVLLAVEQALLMFRKPSRRSYLLFGIFAGLSFSMKYTIGLPLFLTMLLAYFYRRDQTPLGWLLQSLLASLLLFVIMNPFLLRSGEMLSYWMTRVNTLYFPGEDYYGRSVFFYYLDYLARYDYNLPLMLFCVLGLAIFLVERPAEGFTVSIYPLAILVWLCSFQSRRIHGILPLHPFLALWSGFAMERFVAGLRRVLTTGLYRPTIVSLLALLLAWPYYRTSVQSYLFSQTDNRSKAELWMTNRLPQGSKIAVLQYEQMELDPHYFYIQDFTPTDYVFGKKDFGWFRDHGFDYIAVSSGQYMRYFIEGQTAERYRDYFLHLFDQGSREGTLVLDLMTHPLLIPDYRIKIFSTKNASAAPDFIPALESGDGDAARRLTRSGTKISMPPGYYLLDLGEKQAELTSITVKNLKLNEVILKKRPGQKLFVSTADGRYPFAIFPVRQNSRFSLFTASPPSLSSSQEVRFVWNGQSSEIGIKRIQPAIQVTKVEFAPLTNADPKIPYILFEKNQDFQLRCSLLNATKEKVSGYVQGFLSGIGDPQPWKEFETASGIQEFFLDGGQSITIEIPMSTANLTGDHQLSYWVFARQDLPFSPQNGGWFSKQIRVNDPKLGIHPIYGVPIP